MIKREEHVYYTDSVRMVTRGEIQNGVVVTCPNCGAFHGLFYRKHSETNKTLHFYCDRVKRRWMEDQRESWDHTTKMCNVEFVDNLPIPENWTAKCKSTFQIEHTGDLLK